MFFQKKKNPFSFVNFLSNKEQVYISNIHESCATKTCLLRSLSLPYQKGWVSKAWKGNFRRNFIRNYGCNLTCSEITY